jgi:hypothetical protein
MQGLNGNGDFLNSLCQPLGESFQQIRKGSMRMGRQEKHDPKKLQHHSQNNLEQQIFYRSVLIHFHALLEMLNFLEIFSSLTFPMTGAGELPKRTTSLID